MVKSVAKRVSAAHEMHWRAKNQGCWKRICVLLLVLLKSSSSSASTVAACSKTIKLFPPGAPNQSVCKCLHFQNNNLPGAPNQSVCKMFTKCGKIIIIQLLEYVIPPPPPAAAPEPKIRALWCYPALWCQPALWC